MEEVVVITGCSGGGIGHALALAFARQGCRVVATARSLSSMDGLFHSLPSVHTLELDVTCQESRDRAVSTVIEKYGRIDILFNNAGVHCVAPVVEMPVSLLQKTFETNVYAQIGMIQAVIPYMIAQSKGKIVNMGSIVTFYPGAWCGGYSASKAALEALTNSLRLEVKPFGIDVILVAPGAIQSNIGVNSSKIYNTLPKWKYYMPWEKNISERTTYSQKPGCTPTQEFAEKTVEAVLKKNPPPCFTYGKLSFLASILYYLPWRLQDFIVSRMFVSNKNFELNKAD